MKTGPVILSRTDSIGDVVLTLPVAGIIKKYMPGTEIHFLGRKYTEAVIEACSHVDRFHDWDEIRAMPREGQIRYIKQVRAASILHVFPRPEIAELAKAAGIPQRVGATGRIYHWANCNCLVPLSRRHSQLHEAQLNLKLLKPLGIPWKMDIEMIPGFYGLDRVQPLEERMKAVFSRSHFNLVLHPLSKGSAREWGMDNYIRLVELLPEEKYRIYVTGTREEGLEIRSTGIFGAPHITDVTGRLSLKELISFIAAADGLVACSTGPLHLAAAMGKVAIGIYPPIKPMHPGRWAPLGPQASFLVKDIRCNKCRRGGTCRCMTEIGAEEVVGMLGKRKAESGERRAESGKRRAESGERKEGY